MSTKAIKADKYNIGIGLLRIWLSFEVVLGHYYYGKTGKFPVVIIEEYTHYAVPVFMILSFLFIDIGVLADNKEKFTTRIKRLAIPYVFWTFVYFFCYWIIDWAKGYELGIHQGIKGLIISLITGHYINTALWFQLDLIILTAFVVGLKKLTKEHFDKVFLIITILCYVLEYTQLWYRFLQSFLVGKPFYWPIGRLVEMLPFIYAGYLAKKTGFFSLLNSNVRERLIKAITAVLLIALLIWIRPVVGIENDFMYSGIDKLLVAILTIAVFFSISRFNSDKINQLIKFIARYAMGIYFIHNLVGTVVFRAGIAAKIGLPDGNLTAVTFVFVLSVIILIILDRIPLKIIKASVA